MAERHRVAAQQRAMVVDVAESDTEDEDAGVRGGARRAAPAGAAPLVDLSMLCDAGTLELVDELAMRRTGSRAQWLHARYKAVAEPGGGIKPAAFASVVVRFSCLCCAVVATLANVVRARVCAARARL